MANTNVDKAAADAERAKVLRRLLNYERSNKIKTVEDLAKKYKNFTTEELKEKRQRYINKRNWMRKELANKPISWGSLLKGAAKNGLSLAGLGLTYWLDKQLDNSRKDTLLELYKKGEFNDNANDNKVVRFSKALSRDELMDSDQYDDYYRDYVDDYIRKINEQALIQAKIAGDIDSNEDIDSFDLEDYIANDPNIEWQITKKPDLVPEYALAAEKEPEVAELIKQYEAQDAEAYRALRRKQLREESVRRWKESRTGGYEGPFDGYISYRDELKI